METCQLYLLVLLILVHKIAKVILNLCITLSCTLGISSAVPVGTQVVFGCQQGYVFDHDWYATPRFEMTCNEDGLFDAPYIWPVCVSRKI